MATVLISGANRGLGLEFARQYAADGWDVIATARRPEQADELRATGAEVHALDAADPASIRALADGMGGRPIDLLIANAGMMGPTAIDAEGWARTLQTNSIGPTLLANALKANVASSGHRKMVAITSQMGSIADNSSGGYIAYRSSKAALNAAWRSLSIDWRGEVVLALFHPGWVQTDMGGPNASIDAATSVGGMRGVIDKLAPEQSGAFMTWDGRELPW